jgi:hypothetical protein
MPCGLVLRTLLSTLLLLMAPVASSDEPADPSGHLVIPMPADIFGVIFPESAGNSLATLLDEGLIEKWKTALSIYIAYESDSETEYIDSLINTQLRPLMSSVHDATGLGFRRAKSLDEANVVFVFAQKSSDVERFLDFADLRKWFAASDDQEFDNIESIFRQAEGFCFRFIKSPDSEITRAVGFVSTVESATVQEKCLARNLLFAVGLRGKTSSPASAKSENTSARKIGLLDEMALNVLYREGVEPGMTLRQALGK